jgi:hypothetical protein
MSSTKLLWADKVISSPTEFWALIAQLKKSVALGEMKQYWPSNAQFATEKEVVEVNENESFLDDYIEWYFILTENNNLYQLSVDTFHGVGGFWKSLGVITTD